jgi:PAS domain S-box-containing protein
MERLGTLYIASSQVAHAVVRSSSREELLREVVRVLVDAGNFAMAFISWHDPATHELVPVARCGDTHGYVDGIRMFTDERPEGQGPAGAAFRAGIPYVCNDSLNDPRTLPWREAARASGWRASAAFPIPIGGVPRGLLSVYTREAGAFGPAQVDLLREVTLDVAFGLEHLDGERRRRQTEAALAASEHRLKSAIDAAALGTFDWDPQSGKIVWNGHHERMFGFEPGGFDGTYAAFERCLHPDDLPKLDRALDAARNSRSAFRQEFRVVWPDGSEHWIFSRGQFHYSDSGQPRSMYGAVLDITGRKRVEAALLENEERLRQAIRVSDIGIFDHDHLAGALYWSPRQRVIHGAGPDEPASLQAYFDRVHPGDRERIAEAVQRAYDPAGDGLFDVEHRLILPDGSVRWTSTRSQTFFGGEGDTRRPVRTVGAVRDITEQKQAQEEQKKLATLVAMSHDFIGIATLEGRVVYLNNAAMNMVGLQSMMEARQKTILDFFAESDREQARDRLFPGLFNMRRWSGEGRLRNFKTGEPIDVEITAFQIRDDNGIPLYLAAVTRDITERKQAEAERARLEAQLFQAQKMESIGRLAGGVAHDFNNLLTVINGYSALALSELAPSDALGASIEEIRKAGERAAELTRQLLAFSRKQVLQPRALDLNRVVQGMQPMLKRLVGEDLEVCVALDAESGTVYADPHQVEQVIMNLVVNGRDAMPGGGRLLIETACVELDEGYARLHPDVHAGRYVMLALTDNGTGMDEETRRRVFEPFFTTKPAGKGTGLGLSTVQGIVAQSGGHISVYSEPGRGTTFKIYLPQLGEAATDAGKAAGEPVVGGKETVLIVEDMAEVRRYAGVALKAYGYRVMQAESAGEALTICDREEGRIDLLLTDVVMPNLSGRELANRLEERWPDIKVLFMSGYTDKSIALNGRLDERVHFIEKPFGPEKLAEKVRAVLGAPVAAARILVADDEPGVRGFVRAVLERGGYEVVEAADGKQALRRMRAGQVDLLITDLVMPEQEGIEVIQALRRDAPGVGIIAISGAFGGQFLKVAQALGADAVLSKPVSGELLLAKVAEVLKRIR